MNITEKSIAGKDNAICFILYGEWLRGKGDSYLSVTEVNKNSVNLRKLAKTRST